MSMALTTTSAPPGADVLAADLAKLLSRIGRGLRYRTRTARASLDVTQSESELLRLLERHPGMRVHEAAVELGVASNSVSTLVKQLNRVGLIERTADPLDGRAACLRLTPAAMQWVVEVGNAREEAIDRALLSLDASDRQLIESAMPALKRFAKAIASKGGASQ